VCGICGWVYADPDFPVPEALLHRAAEAMRHRGPDEEGLYAGVGVGLGMRRLAVIDRAGGSQPMWSDDRRYAIVYNGEIYNHGPLRQELEILGYTFRTRCDTEVVVKGFAEWGAELLPRLNGMFAFAVWDQREKSLFLARDRLGQKPLYYHEGAQAFGFASEIKSLLVHPQTPREPDLQAISDFLTFKYVPAPRTGFRDIRKLPAGHWARYRNGGLQIEAYWDPDPAGRTPLPAAEALGRVGQALRESVSARLMSDVPLGVMLSGGVDSSLVAAEAAARRPGVGTYTIGFDDPAYDESAHAAAVAGHLGTAHHVETVAPEGLADLDLLVRHLEEPLGDSSALPLLALCRLTRRHVTVALAGDGGDELGAGYPRYRWDARAGRLGAVPGFGRLARTAGGLLERLAATRELGRRMSKFGRTAALEPVERYTRWFACFRSGEKRALLAPEVLREVEIGGEAAHFRPWFRRAGGLDPMTRLQYVDLKRFLADDLLLKGDKVSMAVSLEMRLPFLDHRLVEALLAVPPALHREGGELKALLKRLAAARVPREAVYRRKQGFEVPLARWFRGGLQGAAAERLAPRRLAAGGLLNPEAVGALLERARLGRTDVGHQLYCLLVLEAWHRAFWG
jgi:asparagine synthase (glutamine-hydrolysing)